MLHSFAGQYGTGYNAIQRSNTAFATTTHTASSTAYTYNSTWTQLVSSTAFDTIGIWLRLNSATAVSGGRGDTIVQLGVGAASSEQVVVEFVAGFRNAGTQICLPLFIPSGSRIAVRHKSVTSSKAIQYTFDYYGGINRDLSGIPTKWVSYGLVDSGSQASGTAVTSGSTNAFGSWTALTTNTTYPHSLWIPMIDAGTAATTTLLNYRSQFAIASTSDAATMVTNSTVWDGPLWQTNTSEAMLELSNSTGGTWVIGDSRYSPNGIIYQPMASGSSVSMRAMCSGTTEASVFGSILAAVI